MFTIIAAIGKNLELGKNGDLIWHLPNDLKFFKEKTTGHKIFMGRKTFLSLPKKLPNREHFVLTTSNTNIDCEINIVNDLEKFVDENKDTTEEIFVIGGAQVYKLMLPYVTKMFLTEIEDVSLDADVYFPKFNLGDFTRRVISSNEDNGVKYSHVEYIRK